MKKAVRPDNFPPACDEVENRRPEWVALSFHWQQRLKRASDLYLTIFFGTHRWPTRVGEVQFGLSGGELRLNLNNAHLPLRTREPRGTLPLSYKVTRTISVTDAEKHGRELGTSASIGAKDEKLEASVAVSRKNLREHSRGTTASVAFEDQEWSVFSKGSETEPIWEFEAAPHCDVIRGSYDVLRLGMVLWDKQHTASVEAYFSARPKDLKLIETSNALADLTFVKAKLFRLLIAKEFLGCYLSRAVLPCQEGGVNATR